jgi:phosphatidylinositol glycan class C protein
VQHVCSVTIFVCCFSGIFQERVSPVTVVGWGSASTVLGWVLWDFWVGKNEETAKLRGSSHEGSEDGIGSDVGREQGGSGAHTPLLTSSMEDSPDEFHPPPPQVYSDPLSSLSPRNQQRLATGKSAVLIYCAVLGLSPILKSLTKSTTSDSIWAMSCWLMIINVFSFDYGGGVGAK